MTEHYITDWGMVSINRAKIFNKDDFINEFQDVKLDMLDADIYEGTDYMVIYVTFNVDDVDKYDAEWFKTSRDFVPVYKARGHGSESHSRSSPFLSGHPEAWKGPMRRA